MTDWAVANQERDNMRGGVRGIAVVPVVIMVLATLFVARTTATRQGPVTRLTGEGVSQTATFGHAVAVSGDTLVVGAWQDDVGTPRRAQGSAFVYRRQGDAWVPETRLIAPDGAARDGFGHSVAVHGGTIAVGVPQADVDARRDQGAVYVFNRTGGGWSLQARLIAPAGAATDVFGTSLALNGDVLVVGAPGTDLTPGDRARPADGAVHVFTRREGLWRSTATMTASHPGTSGFGSNVAFDGRAAAVSATGDRDSEAAVYVFTPEGARWVEQARLPSARGAAVRMTPNTLARTLALSGDTLVVGAAKRGAALDGAVLVFVRTSGAWTQAATLVSPANTRGDGFGASVDVNAAAIVVGAWAGNGLRGVAYVFERTGSQGAPGAQGWAPAGTLTAADGQAGDRLGSAVAIDAGAIVVGADNHDLGVPNSNRGAAYAFARVRR